MPLEACGRNEDAHPWLKELELDKQPAGGMPVKAAPPGVALPPGVGTPAAPAGGAPSPAQHQAAWAAYNAQQAMMMQVSPSHYILLQYNV